MVEDRFHWVRFIAAVSARPLARIEQSVSYELALGTFLMDKFSTNSIPYEFCNLCRLCEPQFLVRQLNIFGHFFCRRWGEEGISSNKSMRR